MAGDANNAEVPKISRFITFSREASWEATSKKISSHSAADVIVEPIFILVVVRGSSEAKYEVNDVRRLPEGYKFFSAVVINHLDQFRNAAGVIICFLCKEIR